MVRRETHVHTYSHIYHSIFLLTYGRASIIVIIMAERICGGQSNNCMMRNYLHLQKHIKFRNNKTRSEEVLQKFYSK